MPLYIANCTVGKYRFGYRYPEGAKVIYLDILSGQQEMIGANYNSDQIIAVIAQLEFYNHKRLDEINRSAKGFNGLVFSDKPITVSKIEQGYEVVMSEAEARSAEAIKKGAQTFDIQARQQAKRATGKQVGHLVEVELAEDKNPANAAKLTFVDGKEARA